MRRPFPLLLAVLFVAALAACESPTTGGEPGTREQAQIGFALDLTGLPVATLAVQVTASDITTPLVFNIPVVNGTATGNITVPAGPDRVITVRAFDTQGAITHEGSATVAQVSPGANVAVTITLVPRSGNVPITIHMGSMVMTVTRLTPTPAGGDRAGDSIRFRAQVTHPDGSPVAGASVRWASTNPAVATVDSLGWVRSRIAGTVDIVATYSGFGASLTLAFAAGEAPDQTAPVLAGVDATPDAVTLDSASSTANVTFAVTADDEGTGFYGVSMVLSSPDGTTSHACSANAAPSPGRATRTCSFTLSGAGPTGRWTVQALTVADNAGNTRSYSTAELDSAGFDSGVTVTVAQSGGDTQAPALTGAAFTPDALNVTSGSAQVTLRIEATDNLSGIARVDVSGSHETGGYSFSSDGGALQVGSTTWETYLTVDAQSPPNGWVFLDTVRLTDQAGNVLELGAAELESRGMRAKFFIDRGVEF